MQDACVKRTSATNERTHTKQLQFNGNFMRYAASNAYQMNVHQTGRAVSRIVWRLL